MIDTTNCPVGLLRMPPESTFHPEHNAKQSIVLQDAQIPQEAKDKLSSFLEGDCSSIVSKSLTDVGRTNLFSMEIPTTGPTIACKPYPILLKYKKFIDEEIRLLKMQDKYLKVGAYGPLQ